MKNRVLITSVGRKVGLIRAFRKAGWSVYGQDQDPESVGLRYCDVWYKDNPIYQDGFKCDLWIPTRDAEIEDAWRFNGWDTRAVNTCLDKYEFYKWCKANGFRTPEVYFVKPRFSNSRGLDPQNQKWEHVWQEVIEGDEYSVDLFADFDGNVISVVPRKRVRTIAGESTVSVTVSYPSLVEEATRLSKELSLVGHNVLQCFSVGKVHTWTDVNLRFGGGSRVGIEAGCKSPEWLLKLVNGWMVEPCIGNYKAGLIGRSYSEWVFE